ncbi:hypothetical protein BHU72_01585 [Desulfuribacillus stibiiarsenatis]|uniref:Uncharacterized protein n=1 Tax=Desulfuribacillus stibiiarsenatis TaxID=1390249 RepID=A0A1E5LA27_9FIRM|nr:hypothetical protein [Desulfuribacillus stibiiarsenatis]OEH86975.1 hypothetical protein BHU72_01585 [Desulfuribacillus stibiiarsenatis]
MIEDYIFYLILLISSFLMVLEGLKKLREKRIIYQQRLSHLIMTIITAISTYFTFTNMWDFAEARVITSILLLVFTTFMVYTIRKLMISKKYTIFNLSQSKAAEMVGTVLVELGLDFSRIDENENSIYTFQDSKATIKIKETLLSSENIELMFQHSYDFSFTDEFIDILRGIIEVEFPMKRSRRGVIEIITGVGLSVLAVVLFTMNVPLYDTYVNKQVANDFDFIYSYGFHGKSVMNTYTNTYTKDLQMASVRTTIVFTKEEKDRILAELFSIDILNYPVSFPEYINITPISNYTLEVGIFQKKKTVNWTSNNIPIKSINLDGSYIYFEDKDAYQMIQLMNLVKLIEEIIQSKKEYQDLPQGIVGYAYYNLTEEFICISN